MRFTENRNVFVVSMVFAARKKAAVCLMQIRDSLFVRGVLLGRPVITS